MIIIYRPKIAFFHLTPLLRKIPTFICITTSGVYYCALVAAHYISGDGRGGDALYKGYYSAQGFVDSLTPKGTPEFEEVRTTINALEMVCRWE